MAGAGAGARSRAGPGHRAARAGPRRRRRPTGGAVVVVAVVVVPPPSRLLSGLTLNPGSLLPALKGGPGGFNAVCCHGKLKVVPKHALVLPFPARGGGGGSVSSLAAATCMTRRCGSTL